MHQRLSISPEVLKWIAIFRTELCSEALRRQGTVCMNQTILLFQWDAVSLKEERNWVSPSKGRICVRQRASVTSSSSWNFSFLPRGQNTRDSFCEMQIFKDQRLLLACCLPVLNVPHSLRAQSPALPLLPSNGSPWRVEEAPRRMASPTPWCLRPAAGEEERPLQDE